MPSSVYTELKNAVYGWGYKITKRFYILQRAGALCEFSHKFLGE